jgi:hypothetical protein
MIARCEGALLSKSGAPFLPWGPYLDAGYVCRMRAELLDMIEALAALETWPKEYRDDVLTRAVRGPLCDLMPNFQYFEKRLIAAQCKIAAAELRDARIWHGEGLEDRMTTGNEPTTRKPKTRNTKARVTTLDRMANRVRKEAHEPEDRLGRHHERRRD